MKTIHDNASVLEPVVSVIIPVYNVEPYLSQCLDSVLCQTLSSLEIICIDDCSTDSSGTVLLEYTSRHSSIKTLKHVQNQGLAATRNTGLEAAQGVFVYFLDSDDVLADPCALEKLYNTAIADGADQVMGRMLYWNECTDEKTLDWQAPFQTTEFHKKTIDETPLQIANVSACNKLLRRSFLQKEQIVFNPRLRKHEDNLFSTQVHLLAKSSSFILYTTYLYRQRCSGERSITGARRNSDLFYYQETDREILNFLQKSSLSAEKKGIYYSSVLNWRMEYFFKTFADYNLSDADIAGCISRYEQLFALIPQEHLGYFSPVIQKVAKLCAAGEGGKALKILQRKVEKPSFVKRIYRMLKYEFATCIR